MERQNVSSSNLQSIGYDEESQTLEVEFINGGIYQYFDVPKHLFEDFLNAASVGSFLARNIKGHFRFSKV